MTDLEKPVESILSINEKTYDTYTYTQHYSVENTCANETMNQVKAFIDLWVATKIEQWSWHV